MTQPIRPDQVKAKKPDEVIEVFNNLIQEYWNGKESVVLQRLAASRIIAKLGLLEDEVVSTGLLDIEETYRQVGWIVEYDKPGYNENPYPARFIFRKP